MKIRSVYRSALIRCDGINSTGLTLVKARKIIIPTLKNRLFFAHKDCCNNFRITEALSGMVVSEWYNRQTLKTAILSAEKRIAENVPTNKSFDDFVIEKILNDKLFPITANLRVFNN